MICKARASVIISSTACFSEIDSLVLYAGTHSIRHGYHRLLARRFPHAIYYRMENNEVLVYRVIDCRRDPKWIRQQLKS